MLRVITGRSGSGKSEKCITEFNSYIQKQRNNGLWAYFFVPEQYTMITERRLLEYQKRECFPSLGIIGHEVLNFKRFSHRILSLYGGSSATPLNESGKIMMLTSACSKLKDKLQYFKSVADKPSQASRMLSLIEEFGKYGVTGAVIDNIKTGDSYLERKLGDIKLILNEYSEMKKGVFTDENDLFDNMLRKIKEKHFFDGRSVWIDSFTGFTSSELELIDVMLRSCECVTVTLCTDLSGDPAFECIDKTFARLKKLSEKNGTDLRLINLTENASGADYKYEDESLRILERNITKARMPRMNIKPEAIALGEFKNINSEVSYCAERIKHMHDIEHTEYSHIAVAVRRPEDYEAAIKTAFARYGIPFYIDSKKTLDNNPLIKTVLSVLAIIADDWRREDVLECIKSGIFTAEDMKAADLIENEMLRSGLKGRGMWKRTENEYCSAFYRMIDTLYKGFSGCSVLSDACRVFCEYISACKIKDVIENTAVKMRENGNAVPADEYSRIWNILMDVIGQIALFMGDEPVESARAAASKMNNLLGVSFSQYRIGFLPPDNDSVQILSIERSRSAHIKALFLMGANDGILPSDFDDDGILNDTERKTLEKCGIELADDIEAKASKENFYIYTVLSMPSSRLEISWPLEDTAGNQLKPSHMILRKMRMLFGGLTVNSMCGTESERSQYRDMICRPIRADVNRELFHINGTLYTTVSRIESFYKCPYGFFLSYGLKLKPREEARLEFYDLGNLMHGIIDRSADILFSDEDPPDMERCSHIIDLVYDEAAGALRFNGRELSAREAFALGRIRKYAGTTLFNLKRQADAGSFKIEQCEARFDNSPGAKLKAVEILPDEASDALSKICVTGRIDRYDIMRDGDLSYIRVIDYKSSHHSINEEDVFEGTKLQLITYLNAVVDSFPKGRAIPAGVLYFTFGNGITSDECHPTPSTAEDKNKSFVMNGFVLDDERVIEGMTGGKDVKVIGGQKNKDGISLKRNTNMLKTAADFEAMRKGAHDRIKDGARLITDGLFSIRPSVVDKKSQCNFCKFGSVCANCQRLD